MGTFYLKENDTLPVLSVVLKDPDGDPHDLTSVVTVYLHITLRDGTELTAREMTIASDRTTGVVTYQWVSGDWATGNLVPSPTTSGAPDHRIEYETVGPGNDRLTFPNAAYDTLHIVAELGQGA